MISKYATFPQRLYAFNIDFLVFLVFAFPLSLIVESNLLFWVLIFSFICLYHALLESSQWQATLGKRYANLMVQDEQGRRLTFAKSLARIVLKHFSLLLFFVGFFMIYFRKDRQGLHDILAKTYVINRGYLDSHVGKSHN